MSPGRGDRLPRAVPRFEIRADSREVYLGWEQLNKAAGSNMCEVFDLLETDPQPVHETKRHHRLQGAFRTKVREGVSYTQWQYEVTGGGRVWYVVDVETRTVWVTHASPGHPKRTDRGKTFR